jgi:hypothetical protein
MEHTGTQRVLEIDAVDLSLPLIASVFREISACISRASRDVSVITYPVRITINLLMSELNPSAQRCLPRFFARDFNF